MCPKELIKGMWGTAVNKCNPPMAVAASLLLNSPQQRFGDTLKLGWSEGVQRNFPAAAEVRWAWLC